MLSQKEFLKNVVEKLEQAGIDYVICGSIAASFYGVERSTQDADIIISSTEEQLAKFLKLLGDSYYVSEDTALDALKRRTMFNIIDLENAWKADLIILKETDFGVKEFQRKRKEILLGKDLYILSPEDIVLSKLVWAEQSRSQLQYSDVSRILEVWSGHLDMKYLNKWAKELGVEKALAEIIEATRELKGGR
jgi:predicted nucleotidyltransferase